MPGRERTLLERIILPYRLYRGNAETPGLPLTFENFLTYRPYGSENLIGDFKDHCCVLLSLGYLIKWVIAGYLWDIARLAGFAYCSTVGADPERSIGLQRIEYLIYEHTQLIGVGWRVQMTGRGKEFRGLYYGIGRQIGWGANGGGAKPCFGRRWQRSSSPETI